MGRLNKLSLVAVLLGSGFYGISYILLDQPIANVFHHFSHNTSLYFFYSAITLLGDVKVALSFIVISSIFSISILLKNPQNHLANFLLVMSIAMIAAIFAEITLKFLLARYRPELFFKEGLYGFHYLSHQYLMNSTPSGHATRIFAFATGLSLTWKRFTPFFTLLALIVCLSRLTLELHYLSDVIFGALLGTFVTLWVAKIYTSITISNQTYALRTR